MEPRHPGTIEFVDGATGATVEVVPAESVDPALRWLPGPDGELLRSSLQRREPGSA